MQSKQRPLYDHVPYLRADRRGPLLAQRFLEQLAQQLLFLEELADAIYRVTADGRWYEAADAISAATTWLRSPYSEARRHDARQRLPTALTNRRKLDDETSGDVLARVTQRPELPDANRRDAATDLEARVAAAVAVVRRGDQRREDNAPRTRRAARGRKKAAL